MDSFFGIGIFELFLIAVIALVVLGPERLPGAMRTVAGYFRQIREVSSEFTSQFSEEIKMLEEMDPRRMINDALDPSKTPTSSTNTTKPAAKPAPAKPATTSNAAKSAA
ncbi:MAG: twin-arginine translocase subunit TatB, partial [Caldilinea sp.]|nr:twin-arginine translocase subunit TatB [Caldilinea sp.]